MRKVFTLLLMLLAACVVVFNAGCSTSQPAPSSSTLPSVGAPRPTPSSSGQTASAQPPIITKATSPPPAGAKHTKKIIAMKGDRSPASERTAAESPDPDQLLQQAADDLPVGQIAVNHPNEMKVGQADVVRVRISRDQAANLAEGLPSANHSTLNDAIAVSTSMKVKVIGDPYFDVKALDATEQLVTNKGFTEWSFNVIPRQSGSLTLHVRITAVVRAAGIEKTKDFPVKDEVIKVSVSPMAAVGQFIANNWQWLWSTILVPVALWLWKKKKGKSTGPGSPPSSDDKKEGHAA